MMEKLPDRIDHLVYATTDLEEATQAIQELLGAPAVPGGRHPRWGTRNALVLLGPRTYLELIGPDPEQSDHAGPRPFGLDALDHPRLATWACRGSDLHSIVLAAKGLGVDLGDVLPGGRQKPDGTRLSWTMTDALKPREGGLIPFFIDWGLSTHPAGDAPASCSFVRLRLEHPGPRRLRGVLGALGLDVPVSSGREPALIATLASPRGEVELR